MRYFFLTVLFILSKCCGYAQDNLGEADLLGPFFNSSILFDPLTDNMGYHNYRIPSLLVTQKGTILAVMEGREGMNFDHARNDIVLKRSVDNGANWSLPNVIAQAGDNVVMNPVMVQAKDGTIILAYIYFPEKRHSSDRAHGIKAVDPGLEGSTIEKIFVIKSRDEGLTWSKPQEITKIAKRGNNSLHAICGPGVGITLNKGRYKGRVIIPMSETRIRRGKKIANNYALYSDDSGITWKHGKACPESRDGSLGGNEVQMVELENGDVLVSIRSRGCRLLSRSRDGGRSWEPLKKQSDLVDTGCMSPLLRYRWTQGNKPGVLIHIGVTGRVDGRKRGMAIIALSYDDGKTWPLQKLLYDKAFDYSSLVLLPDGTIGMLAEYDFNGERAKIKFCRFNLKWIEFKETPLSLVKNIIRPKNYFRTHPNHKIPDDMVIQRFKVDLQAKCVAANDQYSYMFELVDKQGDAKLLGSSNLNKYSRSNKNTFLADWYGANVVRVTAKDDQGQVVATVQDTIFVHFSHSQLAGGDVAKLNSKYKGKEYITGKIVNGQLIYQGMRFLPSDISRGDIKYEGTKFGGYLTKEPRVLALKSGNLVAAYHLQVKGSNDAPPGLTLVLTRSADGGKSWTHDQILMQDIKGVVAYASLVEWKNEIHCYFAGGHASHMTADKYKGVYRTISRDEGKTWSKPIPMNEMTKLLSSKSDTITPCQSPSTNALFIPNMKWKGKKGDAYIVPFYVDPVRFLITLDGGANWDMFYDVNQYPQYMGALNEISWALLDDRTIYVASRRQSKSGYKNEMIFDLQGNPTFLGQSRKNHKARRCHQGAVKIPEGPFKGRVVVASNFSGDREEATIAISKTSKAEYFTTRFLTTNAAWGYCHIDWNPKLKGFVLVGESEPYDENENVVEMDGGPDRNERFSIECFAFSPDFYETLVRADVSN